MFSVPQFISIRNSKNPSPTPENISLAFLCMADRGIIVELKRSRDLLVDRIAGYCRPVEIAMD